MSENASIAALKALVQAFNDHDLDRIMSFFADDAFYTFRNGKVITKDSFWKIVEKG